MHHSLHLCAAPPAHVLALSDYGAQWQAGTGITIAADLLRDGAPRSDRPRVVSIEGPERVTVLDAARALSRISGKDVTAFELPRGEWQATMLAAGMSENHAQLIIDLYDAHNAGKIDVEAGTGERRFGTTTLPEVIASLLSAQRHARI